MSLTHSDIHAGIKEWAKVLTARYRKEMGQQFDPEDLEDDDFYWETMEEFYGWYPAGDKELPGVGVASHVDSSRVNDDITLVIKIDNKFYRIVGYYSSYEGSNWDDSEWHEVKPQQKTITEYVPV